MPFHERDIAEELLGISLATEPPHVEYLPNRVGIQPVAAAVVKRLVRLTQTPQSGARPMRQAEVQEVLLGQYADTLHFLGHQVRLAERIAAAQLEVHSTDDDKPQKARAGYQGHILDRVKYHSHTLPAERLVMAGRLRNSSAVPELFQDSFLVVAPPRAGKTFIAATWLKIAGVGLEPALKSSVIVPEKGLLYEYLGEQGNCFFRETLGDDVRVSGYYKDEKDLDGDVVVMTKHMLLSRRQQIPAFDFGIFDEGHHAQGPKTAEASQGLARRMLYLTATSTFGGRDLRRKVTYIEVGSPRKFAEDGVTAPVQLLSFQSDGTNDVHLAAQAALEVIRKGGKVMVFCKAGGQSQQAKDVADRINELAGEETARSIGAFKKDSHDDVGAFRQGDLQCLTTVKMLSEGVGFSDLDAVILVGPHGSSREVTQITGRAVERTADARVKALIEILPPAKEGRVLYSIRQVYGFDAIEEEGQGMVIGDPGGAELLFPIYGGDVSLGGDQLSVTSSYGAAAGTIGGAQTELALELRKAFIMPGPLSDILVAPEDQARREAPAGYASVVDLAKQHNTSIRWLQGYLSLKHNFSYVMVTEKNAEEPGWAYIRWYEPAAVAHLAENPVISLREEGEMSKYDIHQLTGLSYTYLDNLIDNELGLEGIEKLGRRNRGTYYSREDAELILEAIEDIPVADLTDVKRVDIEDDVGKFMHTYCRKNGISAVQKRYHPDSGQAGFCYFFTEEEAMNIRLARELIQPPTADLISIEEIANRASVSVNTVRRSLTSTELEMIDVRRETVERAHDEEYLPRELGEAIAVRLQVHGLPLTQVPLGVIPTLLVTQKSRVIALLKASDRAQELQPTRRRLRGYPGRSVSCYGWSVLEYLETEAGLARRPGIEPIDYTRLRDDAFDRAYAYGILHQFLHEEALSPIIGPDVPLTPRRPVDETVPVEKDEGANGTQEKSPSTLFEAMTHLGCTEQAFLAVIAMVHPGRSELDELRSGRMPPAVFWRLEKRCATLPAADTSWTSHRELVQNLEKLGLQLKQATALIKACAMAVEERAVCSDSGFVDAFYAPSAVSKIMAQAPSQAKN